MKRLFEITALLVGSSVVMMGQTFTKISTIAGSLPPVATAPNNLFLQAPDAVFVDKDGNVYIADTGGNRVWKIDARVDDQGQPKLTRVAGIGGTGGFAGDGKAATDAQLSSPSGLVKDSLGNLYISDRGNHRIRKVDTAGVITTVAGQGTGRFSGDGFKATNALINAPRQLAVDANDNIYIADTGNHRIRKLTPAGIITTVAGSNSSNSFTDTTNGDGGPAILARLDSPEGVAVDKAGNLYISDTGSCSLNSDTTCSTAAKKVRANRIRKVDATTRIITTIAGRTPTFSEMGQDNSGVTLPKVRPAAIPYVATCTKPNTVQGGSGTAYYDNGTLVVCAPNGDGRDAAAALLATPAGITVDSAGNVYVADRDDNRIRFFNAANGTLTTFAGAGTAGDGGSASSAAISRPSSMALGPDGSVYITEWSPTTPGKVRKVDAAGIISTVVGFTRSSTDGPALNVALNNPWGVTRDAAGNTYISDTGNHQIRKIDTSGNVTTIAGTGTSGATDDGNPALGNRITSPQGIAVDSKGVIYFAERPSVTISGISVPFHRIRSIGSDGKLKTLAGLPVTPTTAQGGIQQDPYSGQATDLSLSSPTGVVVDGNGVMYFAESGKNVVRKVLPNGAIGTVAGQYGTSGQEGDGGPATQAQLTNPLGIALDSSGNLYIADSGNHAVRVVTANGIILTVAGQVGSAGRDAASTSAGSTLGYQRRLRNPEGVAVDKQGNVFITDTRNNGIREVVASTGVLLDLTANADNPNANQIATINFDDAGGNPKNALLSSPKGIFVDANENVIVADSFNGMIRQLSVEAK